MPPLFQMTCADLCLKYTLVIRLWFLMRRSCGLMPPRGCKFVMRFCIIYIKEWSVNNIGVVEKGQMKVCTRVFVFGVKFFSMLGLQLLC